MLSAIREQYAEVVRPGIDLVARPDVVDPVVAALGGLLFGFDTAVIAGATAALTAKVSLEIDGKVELVEAVRDLSGAEVSELVSDEDWRRGSRQLERQQPRDARPHQRTARRRTHARPGRPAAARPTARRSAPSPAPAGSC